MPSKQLEYMYSLSRLGMKPGLGRMEEIMEALDHPEREFKSIHISGTNGKGSVAAMIESVLRASGKKTGLYTSPHMYTFNERIRVNGISISDEELSALIDDVKEAAAKAGIELTFFEFTTALCYLHFSRIDLDIAVIEVGMGGLLDATNVVTPELSVITTVGLDHQEFLGNTAEVIAIEKAGIIKPRVPVVVGKVSNGVKQVIEEKAKDADAPVQYAQQVCEVSLLKESTHAQTVQVRGVYEGEVELPLLGAYQRENLMVALTALSNLWVDFPHVQHGIAAAQWEGRLDIVQEHPQIIIDGAHNVDGMEALRDYVTSLPRRDVLILGLKQNRAVTDIVKELAGMFDTVIASEGSYMPFAAEDIAHELDIEDVIVKKNISEAIEEAKKIAGEDGTIVITGSLYLVAAALGVLRPH